METNFKVFEHMKGVMAYNYGGFHLHLLVFPFVYQFKSRKIHHFLQMTSSEGFQHHLSMIPKFVCCGFYMKKVVAFTLKYGSEEKGSSLYKCSILLGFILSKNLRGL